MELQAADAASEQVSGARLRPLYRYSAEAVRQVRSSRLAVAGSRDAALDWPAVVKGLRTSWTSLRETPTGSRSDGTLRWRFTCTGVEAGAWAQLDADLRTLVLRDPACAVDLGIKAEGAPVRLAITLILSLPDEAKFHAVVE